MNLQEPALARLRDWPLGTTIGLSGGRRYAVSKSAYASGRSIKLVATELGGTDYISLNLYELAQAPRLAPCEMPLAKVLAFLSELRPEGKQA